MSDDEATQYAVLVTGLSGELRESLIVWAQSALLDGVSAKVDYCLEIQVALGVALGAGAGNSLYATNLQNYLRRMSDMDFLRVLDYLLMTSAGALARVRELSNQLDLGRSKWTPGVRMGKPGLVERVPEGVQDAVEGAIRGSAEAGRVLARAWGQLHALVPNDSGAYADAVRAAEIAAIAKVQPQHSTATLGSVLGQMKDDGDWRLPLREHPVTPGVETALAMIRTLWHGHSDRHGSVDYADVTHDEARAAVMLAATIVDWFESGVLARRPAQPGDASDLK